MSHIDANLVIVHTSDKDLWESKAIPNTAMICSKGEWGKWEKGKTIGWNKSEDEGIWKNWGKEMPIGNVKKEEGTGYEEWIYITNYFFPKECSCEIVTYASQPYECIL